MSSPPPDYNPAASVLQGGTAPIVPVMGGGGMSPSPDYNAGESVLAVGGTSPPIVAVSGGAYSMEGGKDDDDSDPEEDSTEEEVVLPASAPVQIEVYESFEKDTIERYRNEYMKNLRTNFAASGDNHWKKELKVLIAAYRSQYDALWGPTPNLPTDASPISPDKLFETIPSDTKTIIIFPSIDGDMKTFLKTSQFLYTQGFFENSSASDLKFKKGICVIIYGNLFRIGNEDNISLLYLFLKMKHSNSDSLFLLRDPSEDKDVGLSFKRVEGVTEEKPLLNFLSPSYVVCKTPIGSYDGIVFTNEPKITKEEDMKSKGDTVEEAYTKYYKLSRTVVPILVPSAPARATIEWNMPKHTIKLIKIDKTKLILGKGDCITVNNSDKTKVHTGIISGFRFSMEDQPTGIFWHRWDTTDKKYSITQNEISDAIGVPYENIINKVDCPKEGVSDPLVERIENEIKNFSFTVTGRERKYTKEQDKKFQDFSRGLVVGGGEGNLLCKSLIHLENETSLGTFTLEPPYLTFIRPGARKSNPLICIDELGVQYSPFISGAFRSGESDQQYDNTDKKVKLLIDGKAYLIRVATGVSNNALTKHLRLKDNWEKGIFSRGEAELLNDLQLSPELLKSVFGDVWKVSLADFLDHVSNPDYLCYSNVSIIPSRLCDHTRDFIQKVIEYRYKEELDKSIFKNISKEEPGVWPEEFTKLSVNEYKKHKMGVPFTDGETTKINLLIVSTTGQSGLFQYEAKEEIKNKLQELRLKYKDTYEILE